MRTRTKFGAIALVLGLAAPIAISQAPQTPAPAKPESSMLPAAAAAYAEYQGNVSEVGANAFKTADEIDKAVNTFGSTNLNQLSSGWISYAAIIAAQNPEFAAAVRAADSDYGRERMMLGFRNDLSYARILKGGEQALQTALRMRA
jgi:hypothetical protein